MKISLVLLLSFFVQIPLFFAQTTPPSVQKPPTLLGKPFSPDCKTAVKLNVTTATTYGLVAAPSGFGEIREIKNSNSSVFETEHNTAWYLLTMTRDGELTFEIDPQDTTNDYDFLLYAYTDSTFCDNFIRNKLKPVRSNLSNIKLSKQGATGLKPNQIKNYVTKGIGDAFSASIVVKKGEQYMLILDNVTSEGKGHTLHFNFVKEVEIKGKVVNSDSIPVVADVTLSDNNGNIITETTSDLKGEYNINAKLNENQNYNLTYLADKTFVQTTTINTKELKNGIIEFPNIRTVLPTLKKGEKYKLGNINFFGDSSELLPESFSSVESLYKLMKRNKKMKIAIEGHVNDTNAKRSEQEYVYDQVLSDQRAKTIYDFLIKKGIEAERMRSEGFSNTMMLFPHPKNEAEGQANRRVEIKVISIE